MYVCMYVNENVCKNVFYLQPLDLPLRLTKSRRMEGGASWCCSHLSLKIKSSLKMSFFVNLPKF